MNHIDNPLRAVTLVLSLFLFCRVATAAPVAFTFSGTGINGSVASGAFSIDDAALQPAFYGQISPSAAIFNFSLTVSNIPDGGTASLSFDPQGSSVFFGLDSGGIARIIPGGNIVFPDGNFYQLTANTNFLAPPFTPDYHSVLDFVSFSRVQKDDITWAPAVLAVPEPTGAALLGLGAAIVASIFLQQRLPRMQK